MVNTGALSRSAMMSSSAQVLDEVFNNPEQREKLGQQARRRVEADFSARAMAQRYLQVYREVIGRP